MAKIFVLSLLVAVGQAAPHVVAPLAHHAVAAPVGVAHVGVAHVGAVGYTTGHTTVGAPQVVGSSVAEHTVAGPTYTQTHHELVGHRTVQVGTKGIQTGVGYTQQASVSQAPAYTYVAEPA